MTGAEAEVPERDQNAVAAGSLLDRLRAKPMPVMIVLIAIKLAFLAYFALTTTLVMDEFVQLGWAKYFGHGLFETVWPAKAVGYAVFYELAHVAGWNAVSILVIGRLLTVCIALAILWMVYGCARALDAPKAQAVLILLVLLGYSNFIERIFRTRSEPLAVLFAIAALLVVLKNREFEWKRLVVAGILSGLAFVTTQKSVYFNFALGLGLVIDAALSRQIAGAISRGALLVAGWIVPVVAYCLLLGGSDALAVAENLFFGPMELVTVVADNYTNLRSFVWQTLSRNILLYGICFLGMALAPFGRTAGPPTWRVAYIFSLVITVLVFTHDQPWPYVFVMALPFIVLWLPSAIRWASADATRTRLGMIALIAAIVMSFARNFVYLGYSNSEELDVVTRAEKLVAPGEIYFDGVGMLPNRMEPSSLWLDRSAVLRTLKDGKQSEAYRIFASSAPKIVIWSYRMDAIWPVVGEQIAASYVKISPNILIVGRKLLPGKTSEFRSVYPARYWVYDKNGAPLEGALEIDGVEVTAPTKLDKKNYRMLWRGQEDGMLLPVGNYAGLIEPDKEDYLLFEAVYG